MSVEEKKFLADIVLSISSIDDHTLKIRLKGGL
jgi:hypothetical protein